MNLKKITLALSISIFALISCTDSEKPSIVGEWMIETVDGKELPQEEKMAFIILTEAGICEQGTDGVCELGGDNTIKGKWKLTNNNNDLAIENNDNTKSTYTQVSVTETKLSIMHDVTPITFKRVTKK